MKTVIRLIFGWNDESSKNHSVAHVSLVIDSEYHFKVKYIDNYLYNDIVNDIIIKNLDKLEYLSKKDIINCLEKIDKLELFNVKVFNDLDDNF